VLHPETDFMTSSRRLDPRRLLAHPKIYRTFRRALASDRPGRLVTDFLKIDPGQRVLDIGCGTGDILDELPDDIDYHGFDVNPAYIAAARERYGNRGSFVVRSLSAEAVEDLGAFDVIIALGVLHHLGDALADTLFAAAAKALRSGGRLVTLDGAYVEGQHPIARLLLAFDRGRHVRTPEAYLAIARKHFRDPHATVLHDLIAVPYTHCIIDACAGGELCLDRCGENRKDAGLASG
jgi:SAM-dependent methyltransferase